MCAGCGAATTLIKVSYLRPLEAATAKIPWIRIKIFVDDLQLDQEDTEEDILKYFPASAALVLKVIKDGLGADIAEDKAVLIASNNNLATKLRAEIGEAAGLPALLAKNLGIDVTAGRVRRTTAKAATRKARLGKTAKAAKRLKRLSHVAPTKAKRMVKTNLVPKSVYGAQVTGLDNGELLRLQRMAVAGLPPYCGGKSRRKTLAINGDPTAAAAVAVATRWAKEVWHSANGQAAGSLRLTVLQLAWGLNEKKASRPSWATARGPVAIMHLELARLGWSMKQFNTFTNRNGVEVKLTDFSPAAIRQQLERGSPREHAAGDRAAPHRRGTPLGRAHSQNDQLQEVQPDAERPCQNFRVGRAMDMQPQPGSRVRRQPHVQFVRRPPGHLGPQVVRVHGHGGGGQAAGLDHQRRSNLQGQGHRCRQPALVLARTGLHSSRVA
jgi:hypothetical protein